MKEFVLSVGVHGSRKIDYEKELNPEQLDVVLHGDGPCLVLAGAGSGKTRTITYRVASLLDHGVPADQILLLTFTNKAAREMLSRVEGLLGASLTGLWGGTFHSVANRILRMYAPAVGHTANFTILDQEDSRDLIKVCIKDLDIDTTARRFPSPANIQAMVSYSRNAARNIRDVVEQKHPNFIDLIPTIERIAELYENRKRTSDALDFDDLLIRLRDLLYNNESVKQRLASQFRYILVDEYQDTNTVQADIIRQLASVHRNILVVGDDAQSIYSFRAAEIKNILQFPDRYPETHVFHLTTNYRSTPEILDVANAVIKQNRDQFKKKLKAVRNRFEKPSVVPAATAAQEAQYIAEQMLRIRDEMNAPLSSMAVLFRAAFHSQALEFELMKRDIPYDYRGGMKFFERAHIKDVVAHTRLLSNPKDETAWVRVLGLYGGIGLATAGKIIEALRGCERMQDAIASEISLPSRAVRGWQQCSLLFKKVLTAGSHPSDIIRAVIANGYDEYLEAEYPDFRDRLEDLEQFALFADGYTELKTFLDEVSLTDEYGASRRGAEPVEEERVVLSTIHQAKGLEWPVVFIMHLADGKFPSPRALNEDGGLEEERRLFYVATTRAQKQLFLSYPITGGESLILNQPSQFLQEIPKGIVEEVRLRSMGATPRWKPPPAFDSDDEPTIVLDSSGEKKERPRPVSPAGRDPAARDFLRSVDEL